MASAQVLPTSRKQEHLEAGKRKLEEFRKKKAAERAKKAANSSQPQSSHVILGKKQPLETEHAQLTDSDGAGTSDGPVDPFGVSINNGNNIVDITKNIEHGSLKDADAYPSPSVGDLGQRRSNNHDYASGFAGVASVDYSQKTDVINNQSGIYSGSQSRVSIFSDDSIASQPQAGQDLHGSSSQSSLYEESFQSKESNNSSKDSAVMNDGFHMFTSPPNSASSQLQFKPINAATAPTFVDSFQHSTDSGVSNLEVEQDMHGNFRFNDPMNSDFRETNLGSLASGLSGVHGAAVQSSESPGFNWDVRGSSSHVSLYSASSETNSRSSRPSFLDSLNMPRSSLGGSFQHTEPEKESFMHNTLKSNGMDTLGLSVFPRPLMHTDTAGPLSTLRTSAVPDAFEPSMKFSVSASNGVDTLKSNVNENSMERKHEFYSPKQDEDFAALEQHIEDLTQEKFSLQRALEASRVLAESLAAENSSMTDSYNQQRGVVNQLKSERETLQEEIKAHLVELESIKIECANALLECNAADERAKLLASEVISLEEKALRLRSNGLKLERQLENSNTEIASYKKKMTSLEKEHQDLLSTIDALQEEKKLLQSKLRKASTSGQSINFGSSHSEKKDTSTSTEDLDAIQDTSNLETHNHPASLPETDNPTLAMLPENALSNLEASSAYIPPDQMKMIQNINALISELALEKEELTQALASEFSQSSKLKDLNNELSRKLGVQTQRLELLMTQSMAKENIPARLPDSHTIQENSAYADEGDEVVERVLGWIMKLFPGGPSRRRTSKFL